MRGSIIRVNRARPWLARVELGTDPVTGERRQSSKTFARKRDAEAWVAEKLAEVDRGMAVDASKMTVREYLDYWLDAYARISIEPTTYRRYVNLLRHHVYPVLGSLPLKKLQPTHVQSLYASRLQAGARADGKPGGLAPSTVKQLHAVLHRALTHAVQWQVLAHNPADDAQPPKVPKGTPRHWTAEQVRHFLTRYAGDPDYAMWLLFLTTGLRLSEVLGLRWQDVDLEQGILRLATKLVEEDGKPVLKRGTKTAAGRRGVVLPPVAVAALTQHQAQQGMLRLQLGAAWHDHGLVFCGPMGRPRFQTRVYSRFVGLVRKAGLPHLSPHGMRHTHATLLFEQDVHPKLVSERLGHAHVGITLGTYTHVLPTMHQKAADAIEQVVRPTEAGTDQP